MGKPKAKKPTCNQKKWIAAADLIPKQWLVAAETDKSMILLNRTTNEVREIPKGETK